MKPLKQKIIQNSNINYIKIISGLFIFITIILIQTITTAYADTVSVVDNSIKLANPIGTNDFMSFISMILDIALKIGIPIATGFFIWAGFQYVLAQGNPTKVTAAHNNLKYVVFGTILFLGAWSITDVIIKTYQSVTGS